MILKEVGDRVYVKGGPECKKCQGTGKYTTWRGGYVYRRSETKPCRNCHGNGVQAVQDWSDAQKAEWLRDNAAPQYSDEDREDRGWLVFWYAPGDDKWAIGIWNAEGVSDVLSTNKDFSEALTAAVIAVAKESI